MIDLVPDRLYLQSALHKSKVALVLPDSGRRVTYEALSEGVARVAGGLRAQGIGAGDRVATLALNGLPHLELLFASARLGAILVPLDYRLGEPELCRLGADAAPGLLCYQQPFAARARALARATGARPIALDGPGADDLPYAALREAEPVPALPLTLDTPWCILYTAGGPGRPRGAVLTHGSMLWNAINTDLSWGLREDDVAPIFLPMFHTGGLNVLALPLLLLGGTLVVPPRFEPEQALECITRERATLLFLVPGMLQRLTEAPGFDDADLSSVRWALFGGASCPGRLYDLYRRKVRTLKCGYSPTEVGPNVFAMPDRDAHRKRGSVGRPTLLARVRVVDPAGRDLPPGEVGELLLAGPTIGAGYWRNPEDTARAHDGEWLRTGHLARCDEEGFFYMVDLRDDPILHPSIPSQPSESP